MEVHYMPLFHPAPSVARCVLSLGLALLVSWRGVRRKSLSLSGGVAAVVVGAVLTAASGCFSLALLTFFFTSSRLTKWRSAEKKKLEYDHKEGGQRDWVQVVCNGGVATMAALCYTAFCGFGERPFYLANPFSLGHGAPSGYSAGSPHSVIAAAACMASLACACGDTWASEVGSVVGGTPYLVTRCCLRRVPRGTNGGVTLIGLACSLAGGLVVGLAYYVGLAIFVGFENTYDALLQIWVVPLGGVAGFWGSLVDSLLGATLQYSGYSKTRGCVVHAPLDENVKHISGYNLLDNHSVNLLASAITAISIAGLVYVKILVETLDAKTFIS